MMQTTALRREDGLGLGVAVALHLALVAALLTQAPERLTLGSTGTMTVTLRWRSWMTRGRRTSW
jgi:hypothetical protein